jgi:hypothetical protein
MEKYKSKDKEIKVGQAFKSQLSLKAILKKPFKIYPLFVDETNRVIDRDLIIHSHNTFNNEVNNNYTKGYMNTLYNLLFRNNKKYYLEREQLTLSPNKKINKKIKKNSKNLSDNIIPSLNLNTQRKKTHSLDKKILLKIYNEKLKSRNKKQFDNYEKEIKLLKNDNSRIIKTLCFTDRNEKYYQANLKLNIDKRILYYMNKLNNLKTINFPYKNCKKYQNIY